MPEDFRDSNYSIQAVRQSGQYIGRNFYWKLFSLENVARILIYSVLSEQMGRKWWVWVTSPDLEGKIKQVSNGRTKRPYHSAIGAHPLYNIFLPDLTKIIKTFADQFRPLYSGIDDWVLKLEAIQQPRNLLGHMNWVNTKDRRLIDSAYGKAIDAMNSFEGLGFPIRIPRK